nr:ATP-binding protein [Ohessyouella blattaphilus]
MSNRRKILIEGKPGTGKTFTASIIASETRLPLYIVQMDKLVTKFMGETSTKLRQIFDSVENSVGVYLFDEFDAIGADRSLDNEVGEMRRILNSFLQFIEQDSSDSIIVAATNNQKLLDQALFRRFDDVLHYPMPTESEVKHLYEYKIASFQSTFAPSKKLVEKSIVLSHAEIIRVCEDAIKESILDNCEITQSKLLSLVEERLRIYNKKEA